MALNTATYSSQTGNLEISRMKSNSEDFLNYCKTASEPSKQFGADLGHGRRAAILLPFAFINNEMQLIVTRRHPAISDYPNEISFPGGAVDDGDKNSIDTALREAREEIGLKPGDVTIIGSFDDMVPTFRKRRGQQEGTIPYFVSVVIGFVRDGFSLKQNSDEVDEIIFGSINCMFSSLHRLKVAKSEVLVMKLNKNCDIYMYGFSTLVTIVACIILDLVPKECLNNLKSIMADFVTVGNKYFPQYILDYIKEKLEIDHMIGNGQIPIVSKI